MENALITVIVPVYNVEEYLAKCVETIINQTYRNLEIILVDDGSTDSCGTLCDSYKEKDNRIIVIHKENGGLSNARNAALDIATGKYVVLLDSDDYLASDYVEYMYNLLVNYNADIAACEIKKIYSYDEELDVKSECVEVLSGFEALQNLLYQRKVPPCAVCKLYKRELFDNIRYPKGMYYEDLATLYKLLHRCGNYVVGNQQKYYYLQRRNSIMNEEFNVKKMHRIQVANEMKEYVDARYPDLQDATSTRCFIAGLQVYREIPRRKKYVEYADVAWQQIENYRLATIKNHKAKLSTRIMAMSSYMGKRVLAFLGVCYSIVTKK